jgi:GTP cyclohydrolase IA
VIGKMIQIQSETPRRVAKAYVFDLWAGRYTAMSDITSFPSDGYDGIVIERNIPINSMCSHHHQTIGGVVHIGYVVGKEGTRNWLIQIKPNSRAIWP